MSYCIVLLYYSTALCPSIFCLVSALHLIFTSWKYLRKRKRLSDQIRSLPLENFDPYAYVRTNHKTSDDHKLRSILAHYIFTLHLWTKEQEKDAKTVQK